MGLRHRRAWLALGWLALGCLAWGSLTPHPPQGPSFAGADKLGHALAYGFLALYFAQLTPLRRVGLGLFAYGWLLEGLQAFGGTRLYEWADLAANGTGIGLGILLAAGAAGRSLVWLESKGNLWNSG